MHDYLALHGQVDICLDTYPYSSGTTGFHALWMGVPTLTMVGPTLPGHVTSAILSHAGLFDFIAHGEADFLEKGVYHANHLAQLADIRLQLRDRMNNSASGQPALIAAGLELALRSIWRRWCDGQSAEILNIDSSAAVASLQEGYSHEQ